MLVVKKGYEFFAEQIDSINDVLWKFTPEYFAYGLEYFPVEKDFTISVFDKDELKVSLVATTTNDEEVHYFNHGAKFFFSKNGTREVFLKSVKMIMELLTSSGVKRCSIEHDVISAYVFYDYFQKTKNLRLLINSLSLNNYSIRKSYRSLINKQNNENNNIIVNTDNLQYDYFNDFRMLHYEASGSRFTRSSMSWQLQFSAIEKDRAFLSLSYNQKGQLVSGALFLTSVEEVYYGVSAQSRVLMANREPTGHIVLKKALVYSKEKGFKRMILGACDFADEKERQIVFFKRGFADSIVVENTNEYVFG